jgi:hypothetical protein
LASSPHKKIEAVSPLAVKSIDQYHSNSPPYSIEEFGQDGAQRDQERLDETHYGFFFGVLIKVAGSAQTRLPASPGTGCDASQAAADFASSEQERLLMRLSLL